MKDFDDVQQLLRLKRYETPGEDYFEEFAERFKDRQRAELLQRSSRSLLVERVSVWIDELSPNRWATPVAAAACLGILALGTFAISRSIAESPSGGLADASPGGTAENFAPASTLPEFEESAEEVIELSLPQPAGRIPGHSLLRDGKILTVRAGGFREL